MCKEKDCNHSHAYVHVCLQERECVAGGQTIGDVLHAAYFDLEFPDMDLGPRSECIPARVYECIAALHFKHVLL